MADLAQSPLVKAPTHAVDDEATSAGAGLNLKQAARLLGVHYMTAYRYVRQGRLAARRAGTKWLVSEQAVQLLRAELDVGRATEPNGRVRPSGRRQADWAARLYSCLLAGDEPSAWRVVRSALAAGHSVSFCYSQMLTDALAMLGSRWAAGEIAVADQYLATAVASRVVARLGAYSRRPGRSRGTVVFGAPLGELHALPISIAADLVRAAGFGVLELGANAPPEAFAMAAQRAPRLVAVGIGVTSAEWLPFAQQAVDSVRAVEPDVPIVLGGQAAITAAGSELRGVTAWAPDGPAAVKVIEELTRVKARARAARESPASLPAKPVPNQYRRLATTSTEPSRGHGWEA
jgi:excisionase family DNA binding protein